MRAGDLAFLEIRTGRNQAALPVGDVDSEEIGLLVKIKRVDDPVSSRPATMSTPCTAKMVVVDNYIVVVNPKSLAARLWGLCKGLWFYCKIFMRIIFFFLLIYLLTTVFLAIFSFSFVWIPLKFCHKAPGIAVQDVSIVYLTLYPSNATSTPDASAPWQVSSDFNVTLSMWNTNTVARCFTTYRTTYVDVRFKNNLIVRQAVPLGFSLKPRKERVVAVGLKGDRLALKKDLVPVMEAELRDGNVTLEFFFNTRYLIADRRSKWTRFGCVVVGKSPLVDGFETLLGIDCYGT